MKYSFLFVLLLGNIIFLSSCSLQNDRTAAGLNIEKGILFYSDENNISEEDSYYEALIELKDTYPSQFENYVIVAKNKENASSFAFLNDTYPALLVIEDNKVVCKVAGKISRQEILKPVSDTLKEWN
ncbi:hypothetical protein FZC84_14590 [Rossellomorea vietnamensis]|uniref:Small peptidoglycan-associated lipoprotein n=1 Tax=Rossellomorea vietnamensis TaxID=218284 RepID=A0A5D4M8Z3_9BACI|nr:MULTISPECIES: hypothetical protein [Bacillaceae]TYR98399.1 hypothetical protein FZC84_14590 [Rossellomorea vietnamensis]